MGRLKLTAYFKALLGALRKDLFRLKLPAAKFANITDVNPLRVNLISTSIFS
jgi:hypothetical protein